MYFSQSNIRRENVKVIIGIDLNHHYTKYAIATELPAKDFKIENLDTAITIPETFYSEIRISNVEIGRSALVQSYRRLSERDNILRKMLFQDLKKQLEENFVSERCDFEVEDVEYKKKCPADLVFRLFFEKLITDAMTKNSKNQHKFAISQLLIIHSVPATMNAHAKTFLAKSIESALMSLAKTQWFVGESLETEFAMNLSQNVVTVLECETAAYYFLKTILNTNLDVGEHFIAIECGDETTECGILETVGMVGVLRSAQKISQGFSTIFNLFCKFMENVLPENCLEDYKSSNPEEFLDMMVVWRDQILGVNDYKRDVMRINIGVLNIRECDLDEHIQQFNLDLDSDAEVYLESKYLVIPPSIVETFFQSTLKSIVSALEKFISTTSSVYTSKMQIRFIRLYGILSKCQTVNNWIKKNVGVGAVVVAEKGDECIAKGNIMMAQTLLYPHSNLEISKGVDGGLSE
ncbi:hypothetical protein HK098_001088 [Nowakowskiella sp. JEL0407]|nr:hypothetical protein HK098_001088 [Nowakowskiella sp. JEL0407]